MNTVQDVPDLVPIRNVLVSVFDKTGLDGLVKALTLTCPGVRFFSTGGTYTYLRDLLGDRAEKQLVAVSDYTGQPEMQGGLVKTLDFKIYLGLLSEPYNPAHHQDLERTGAEIFDLTVVNLYPFGTMSGKEGATLETARSYIDIGGPTMLRASSKNFLRVATLSSPEDYPGFIDALSAGKGTTALAQRLDLGKRLFARTAAYDLAISRWLEAQDPASILDCYTIKE